MFSLNYFMFKSRKACKKRIIAARSGMALHFQQRVGDNYLRVETRPHARLQMMLDAIDTAKQRLDIIFYRFDNDEIGRLFVRALVSACGRGVKLALVVDGFGTPDHTQGLFAPLIEAGAKIYYFHAKIGRRYLLRNHQKLILADGRDAYIGGANITAKYFRTQDAESWEDLLLHISGAAAARLQDYFESLQHWLQSPHTRAWRLRALLSDHSEASGTMRWLFGGFYRRLSPLTRMMRRDIEQAQSLHMVQSYFAPNRGMLKKLCDVARRGGVCEILTASMSDNSTTVAAARHCYTRLLNNGACVFEYTASLLHTKLIVADDKVYIGSANFDPRSLYLNVELMLRIEDAEFAGQCRALIASLQEKAQAITPALHAERASWMNRVRWLVAYFIMATLDYTVSRRLNIRDSVERDARAEEQE
jgi:cardiolipin synthase A/B